MHASVPSAHIEDRTRSQAVARIADRTALQLTLLVISDCC